MKRFYKEFPPSGFISRGSSLARDCVYIYIRIIHVYSGKTAQKARVYFLRRWLLLLRLILFCSWAVILDKQLRGFRDYIYLNSLRMKATMIYLSQIYSVIAGAVIVYSDKENKKVPIAAS